MRKQTKTNDVIGAASIGLFCVYTWLTACAITHTLVHYLGEQ